MTWYANDETENRVMYPSNAKAWKYFDRNHPNLASETRNIRLGYVLMVFLHVPTSMCLLLWLITS